MEYVDDVVAGLLDCWVGWFLMNSLLTLGCISELPWEAFAYCGEGFQKSCVYLRGHGAWIWQVPRFKCKYLATMKNASRWKDADVFVF